MTKTKHFSQNTMTKTASHSAVKMNTDVPKRHLKTQNVFLVFF